MLGWGWQVPPEHQQYLWHYTSLIVRVPWFCLRNSSNQGFLQGLTLRKSWKCNRANQASPKFRNVFPQEDPNLAVISGTSSLLWTRYCIDFSVGTSVPSCRDIEMSICFSSINFLKERSSPLWRGIHMSWRGAASLFRFWEMVISGLVSKTKKQQPTSL